MRKSVHPAHKALYYSIAILSALILFTFIYFSYVVFLNTLTELTYFYIITVSVLVIVIIYPRGFFVKLTITEGGRCADG